LRRNIHIMKYFLSWGITLGIICIWMLGFHQGKSEKLHPDAVHCDTVRCDTLERALTDTAQASVNQLIYRIDILDTISSDELTAPDDLYGDRQGVLTFRGAPSRRASFHGGIVGKPSNITVDWVFKTGYDTVKTSFGVWGGGTGWTGQPLYVCWPDSLIQRFADLSPGMTPSFSREEIIVGSLAGFMYFIDYQTGKASRQPIDVHNPVKGTPSLDPSFNGNLYVGQGVPREKPFGHAVLNLFSHRQTHFFPEDGKAWRGWGAFDSSPVAVGNFLFWCGENGTLYKYLRTDEGLKIHSTLRYTVKGKTCPGMEASPAIYKNYGYLTDNHGNIICINLNTLKPIWHYNNYDDTDASPVVEEEDGIPFVYSGCEIDKQGNEGHSHFVKLNGLTGEKVWEQTVWGKQTTICEKQFNGGMYASPLTGSRDCEGMIFSNFCINEPALSGELIAMNRQTGEIIYRTPLKRYAWSSPVALFNDQNEMYLFTADTGGNVYLIQGKTGEIILTQKIGNNFESSPLIIDNSIVIGSRGREIYKLNIE